tara:strand:+ start:19887 stop:20285 length:399 start_codon:yes stop_codon:yes gene_type:complete
MNAVSPFRPALFAAVGLTSLLLLFGCGEDEPITITITDKKTWRSPNECLVRTEIQNGADAQIKYIQFRLVSDGQTSTGNAMSYIQVDTAKHMNLNFERLPCSRVGSDPEIKVDSCVLRDERDCTRLVANRAP